MSIPLDRHSPCPLYRQVEMFLSGEILKGRLPPETRLMASRGLADELGVSRMTITNAYAELEAQGLIYARPGSGTYVAKGVQERPPCSTRLEVPGSSRAFCRRESQQRAIQLPDGLIDQTSRDTAHPREISLAGDQGAPELCARKELRRAMLSALASTRAEGPSGPDAAGWQPLRATISRLLSIQGIAAPPGNILVTSGSQQGVALVAHLLLRPGDAVIVEAPTSPDALAVFRSLRVRPIEVPIDKDGMKVEDLEDLLRRERPALIYTMPTFQNPTGYVMSLARRRMLVDTAALKGVPILEEDFAGNLRYEGRAEPALKALDPGGFVIYLCSFPTVLTPDLRMGFLVTSESLHERLLALKRTRDPVTSPLLQEALEGYLSSGRFRAHLRRALQAYRRRRDSILAAATCFLPSDTVWARPRGGVFLWMKLPDSIEDLRLQTAASREGVAFFPGSKCYAKMPTGSSLRLNFVCQRPEMIWEGMRRLGNVIRTSQLDVRSGLNSPSQQTSEESQTWQPLQDSVQDYTLS